MANENKVTNLMVNLKEKIRPIEHVATGALYGITEEFPSAQVIREIHPKVVRCSPEAGHQQPRGAAVPVAGRLAEIGTKVQICLPEWLLDFPYDFKGMDDWFAKLEKTVTEVKASGLTNFDGYEIWNEPDWTWKGKFVMPCDEKGNYHLSFRVMTKQDGVYEMTVRYANGADKEASMKVSANGGGQQIIAFPSTGNWYRAGGYGDAKIRLELKAGVNRVRFEKDSAEYIEFDYLDVEGAAPVRYEAEAAIRGHGITYESGYASSDLTDHLTFEEFYLLSRNKILELDPEAKFIGPSNALYLPAAMRSFLAYQKAHGEVPEIVCWHQLADEDFTANYEDYRRLEKELGISPRKVTINEYSGGEYFDDEGRPGACAPLIAKFERLGVDSALQSYWNNQGTLGSILTVKDQLPNGGYWFYKWYADMTGDLVKTVPEDVHNSRWLDGFAAIDEGRQEAAVLFGGESAGKVMVAISGIPAAWGEAVTVVIEHTPFKDRFTGVSGPETIMAEVLAVRDGQLEILVDNVDHQGGCRLLVKPSV